METKYNQIVFLIHPLYDLFYTHSVSKMIYDNQLDGHLKNLLKDKHKNARLKKSLMIYSKFLIENVKKDSVVLFLKPTTVDQHIKLSIIDPITFNKLKIIENKYNESLGKFIDFFKKKFLNRFFIYDKDFTMYVSGKGWVFQKDILPQNVLKQLNKNVKIISLGEYLSVEHPNQSCVNLYSERLKLFLKKRRISSEIIFKSKYTLPFENTGGFRQLLLKPNERRKLQNKEKKKKLNLKRKLK